MTFDAIANSLADREGWDPQIVRFVFQTRLVPRNDSIDSILCTSDSPLTIWTKPSTPTDDTPPPSLPPPPSESSPNPVADPDSLGTELPPWMISRGDAVAQLVEMGYQEDLCHRALDLCESLELASILLASGNVTEEGRRALQVGRPEVIQIDGDQATRIFKGVFDNPDLVTQLKSGKTINLAIFHQGTVKNFLFSPADADLCLQNNIQRTLEEFQPGDPFRPDLQPLLPPQPHIPPPAPPPLPNPPERAIYAEIRRNHKDIFDALDEKAQEDIATLMEETHCTFEDACEQYGAADRDVDLARAFLVSVRHED
jgi:hypothetical protein